MSSEILFGDAKDLIIEQSSQMLADLVILGARGVRGLQRVLLGSVSQSVPMYGQLQYNHCKKRTRTWRHEDPAGLNSNRPFVSLEKSIRVVF